MEIPMSFNCGRSQKIFLTNQKTVHNVNCPLIGQEYFLTPPTKRKQPMSTSKKLLQKFLDPYNFGKLKKSFCWLHNNISEYFNTKEVSHSETILEPNLSYNIEFSARSMLSDI